MYGPRRSLKNARTQKEDHVGACLHTFRHRFLFRNSRKLMMKSAGGSDPYAPIASGVQLSMIGARAVLAVSTKIGFYKVVLMSRPGVWFKKARPPCANLNKMLQMLRVYAYWTPDPLAPTLKLAHGGRLK